MTNKIFSDRELEIIEKVCQKNSLNWNESDLGELVMALVKVTEETDLIPLWVKVGVFGYYDLFGAKAFKMDHKDDLKGHNDYGGPAGYSEIKINKEVTHYPGSELIILYVESGSTFQIMAKPEYFIGKFYRKCELTEALQNSPKAQEILRDIFISSVNTWVEKNKIVKRARNNRSSFNG